MMKNNQAGFSLIELAVALFILVLILGSILVPLGAQVEQRQTSDTQRILDETREALIGFVLINGRLPRPAVSSTDGAENGTACASETACTGFIPWATLGTTKTDAWGKIIRYSVTPAFANSAFTYAILTTGATKTIRTRTSAGALTNLATGVPAVIFSNGMRSYGTTDTGAVIADSSNANADEDSNNTADTIFIMRTASSNASGSGGEFDDLVVWISTSTLVSRIANAGKLPN